MITTSETLKVKKHIVVTTKQILDEKRIEEIEILSSNHVFVKEARIKSQMKDAQKSPASFEEGN